MLTFIDPSYTDIITISFLALLLFVIKNKIISFVLAISEKTSTVYDELLLYSIKRPSSYLIILGYLILLTDFLSKINIVNFTFSLSASIFILFILTISWSIIRGLNYYLNLKPFLNNLTQDDDAALVTETYEIVIRIIKVIVVIITLLILMQELGLSISGLLAFGGVGGLIVGLAAKDLLSNFFGGMMIFLIDPLG